MITPVKPEDHHFQHMFDYLPKEQHEELDRYDGSTIHGTLLAASLPRPGKQLWALVDDQDLTVGFTGMAPYKGISGIIGCSWVLTTCHMQRDVRGFLRTAKLVNEHYAHSFPYLVGDVDVSYAPGLRLMRHLGYEEGALVTSPAGHPFQQFIYRRP